MSTTSVPTAPRGRPAAFFDLDGTLIRGSANIPLALAAFRRGMVSHRELARDLRQGASFLLRGASDDRSAQVRERILAAVKGHRQSDVAALGDEFIESLAASVRPELRAVLAEHAARGEDRIIVSASPIEIVDRLAREIGLEGAVATTSEVVDGRYTGRLEGPFCYREGKALHIARLAAEAGYDLAASYAYSDSVSDLPMLRAVGHPVAVNPEAELRAVAVAEGWPIVETSGLRGLSARTVATAVTGGTVRAGQRLARLGRPTAAAGRAAVTRAADRAARAATQPAAQAAARVARAAAPVAATPGPAGTEIGTSVGR
jgi:HAD superfamily hydrolase (TIGR01490 family)